MKVINVCDADWANFAHDNMMALQSVGIDCTGAKMQPHTFAYHNSLEVVNLVQMKKRIAECEVVQFFHDNIHLFRALLPAMLGKKIIAYHTSSYYRKNFDVVNSCMNPFVYRSVNAMPEFMGKGAKNEVYMVGAVDTDFLRPSENLHSLVTRFAHYPSNAKVKGTDDIKRMMVGLMTESAVFHCDSETCSYTEHLHRMNECDVYIELFSHTDGNGMPYGNFGITALEAAAMGKLVVTQCNGIEHYIGAYGKPFFYIADDEAQFRFVIKTLAEADPGKLRELQKQKREILVANHGYQATGIYFRRKVL